MVTSFATISSSFAWLPERQLPPICYALVLGHSFGFGCLRSLQTGSQLTLGTVKLTVCVKVRTRVHTYARICKYIHTHVCTFWQVQFLTLYYCSNPPTTKPHTLLFTHALTNTCVSTHLPTRHSHSSHINSLASVTRGVTHTHTCAHMQTQTHTDTRTQSCCLHRAYPFDPLTGTRRISKWEEKPQSRSTSQRRALSIGSCRTPQGSRGCRLPLPGSYNSPLRKWGVSGALSTSVWERSRRTRGQTRMGPLISCIMYDVWHVFEYLHVSEGDANREEKRGRKFRELCFLLSTKTVCKQLSMMQFQSWTSNSAYRLLIRVPHAYIKKISDQVPVHHSMVLRLDKQIFGGLLFLAFCCIASCKSFWSYPLTTAVTFTCEHWFQEFPSWWFSQIPSGPRYVERTLK